MSKHELPTRKGAIRIAVLASVIIACALGFMALHSNGAGTQRRPSRSANWSFEVREESA